MGTTRPTYDLPTVQALMHAGRFRLTLASVRGAADAGLDVADVVQCVCALDLAQFHKTMEADQRPGYWQDVYRTSYDRVALYVKLQLERASADEIVVVIQFKRR